MVLTRSGGTGMPRSPFAPLYLTNLIYNLHYSALLGYNQIMAKKYGRPTVYKEEYCDLLVDHMEQGLSYESFAGLIGVTRDCLYKWEKAHPDFLYNKRVGKEKMTLFFEQMGIDAMTGKIEKFNAPTYIFTLKNKIGWTDKQEVSIDSGKIEINISEEDNKL